MTSMLHDLKRSAAAVGLLLVGCTVGPDYKGPPEAAPIAMRSPLFHRAPAAPVTPAPPVSRWWDALRDLILTRLIDDALARSPTLRQAEARVRSARATIMEQRAGLFPKGGANALAARAQIPLGGFGSLAGASAGGTSSGATSATGGAAGQQGSTKSSTDFNLFDVGFDASWEIDLFGGTRRGVESARAQAEADEAHLADAQLQLTAEVAQAYINLRDVQRRAALTQSSIDLETRMLALTRQQRGLGVASQADVERVVTQLGQTRASLPTLQAQVDQYLDQLAMLTGMEAGQLDALLSPPAAIPMPPASVPIGDPAGMLRRRPDIRQAERQLASSNAMIGQSVAQLFPTVNLLGSVGFSSSKANKLFTSDSFTILGGPSLSWNIFNIPRTLARIDEAKAGKDEALARYEGTVLSALQDAETSLSRFGRQRDSVEALADTEASARRAAALTRQRQQAGTATLIDVLDTERQRTQAEQSLVQSEATLTNSYVSLQKALGLGWGSPPPTGSQVAAGD